MILYLQEKLKMTSESHKDVEKGESQEGVVIDPTPDKRPMHPCIWRLLLGVG